MVSRVWAGRSLVRGSAQGSVLRAGTPISLWGGVDPGSGRIIDHRHDLHGESVAGRVLALPAEKGSSTGSAVLLELIRTGNAPCAIVIEQLAPILTLGAIVAEELYGQTIPIVQLTADDFQELASGMAVQISESGEITERVPSSDATA